MCSMNNLFCEPPEAATNEAAPRWAAAARRRGLTSPDAPMGRGMVGRGQMGSTLMGPLHE